jgi:hypothetical protein
VKKLLIIVKTKSKYSVLRTFKYKRQLHGYTYAPAAAETRIRRGAFVWRRMAGVSQTRIKYKN